MTELRGRTRHHLSTLPYAFCHASHSQGAGSDGIGMNEPMRELKTGEMRDSGLTLQWFYDSSEGLTLWVLSWLDGFCFWVDDRCKYRSL